MFKPTVGSLHLWIQPTPAHKHGSPQLNISCWADCDAVREEEAGLIYVVGTVIGGRGPADLECLKLKLNSPLACQRVVFWFQVLKDNERFKRESDVGVKGMECVPS